MSFVSNSILNSRQLTSFRLCQSTAGCSPPSCLPSLSVYKSCRYVHPHTSLHLTSLGRCPSTAGCSPLLCLPLLFVYESCRYVHNITIIIALKGAIRDFLQSPHSAANCLQHVRSSGPGAIVCKSRTTHRTLITCKCHVTCHLVRRDISTIKFD